MCPVFPINQRPRALSSSSSRPWSRTGGTTSSLCDGYPPAPPSPEPSGPVAPRIWRSPPRHTQVWTWSCAPWFRWWRGLIRTPEPRRRTETDTIDPGSRGSTNTLEYTPKGIKLKVQCRSLVNFRQDIYVHMYQALRRNWPFSRVHRDRPVLYTQDEGIPWRILQAKDTPEGLPLIFIPSRRLFLNVVSV